MNRKIWVRISVIVVVLLCTGRYSQAQMQFPGIPLGPSSHLKAADVMYVLPPLDPLELESRMELNRSNLSKVIEFATVRTIDISPETHGSWQHRNGQQVWIAHIISPGAYSLGLIFNKYRLKPGVKVFVYDPEMHHIKGAFTSGNNKKSGILPVGHLEGDEIIVELQVPEGVTDYGELRIESVSHAYLDLNKHLGTGDCDPGIFGCSQDCMIDVNCEEAADWQKEKRSVVRIYITKNSTSEYCSGVLINNSAYDGTPYILTAEHCINRDNFAANSVFVFDYESPSCFGGDGDNSRSIAGGELLAVGDSIDFSLIRLSLTPPPAYDPYYAGWDRTGSLSEATTTIHHPNGDVKKITLDYEAPSIPSKQSDVPYLDLYDYYYFSYWWIKRWDVGSTQGGSSGSPLFNTDGQLIGLLSGGSARCGDSIGYDDDTNRVIYNNAFNVDDYYAQIKYAWDYKSDVDASLKQWLDPGHTGVNSLGGYEPAGIRPFNKDENHHFNIFPNPATRILHLSSDFPHSGKTSFEVLSLNGAVLLHGQLEASVINELDISSLDPGIYLLRLFGNQLLETHKLLISP